MVHQAPTREIERKPYLEVEVGDDQRGRGGTSSSVSQDPIVDVRHF